MLANLVDHFSRPLPAAAQAFSVRESVDVSNETYPEIWTCGIGFEHSVLSYSEMLRDFARR